MKPTHLEINGYLRTKSGGISVRLVVVEGLDIVWNEPLKHLPYGFSGNRPLYHSPNGFNVGYLGSGCADLAFAICAYFGKPKLYQDFKTQVIAKLNQNRKLLIPLKSIYQMLEKIERGEVIL